MERARLLQAGLVLLLLVAWPKNVEVLLAGGGQCSISFDTDYCSPNYEADVTAHCSGYSSCDDGCTCASIWTSIDCVNVTNWSCGDGAGCAEDFCEIDNCCVGSCIEGYCEQPI
jgi:hypothetical protein